MKLFDMATKREKIISSFRNSGLWPFDPQVMCCKGIRKCSMDALLVSMTRLNSAIRSYILSFKRHGPPEINAKGGYIDTSTGTELTRANVREKMRQLESERLQKN